MELDDLKYLLNKVEAPRKSSTEIGETLRIKSTSVIHKIRRNIRFEILLALLFWIASLAWYLNTNIQLYKLISGFLVLFLLVFLYYIKILNRQINKHLTSVEPVKQNLEQVTRIMDLFVRLYFQFTMWMLPFFVIVLFTLDSKYYTSLTVGKWMVLAAWFIGWSAFTYFITRWYLKKLYGNYISDLKKQLKELEEI